MGVANKSAIVPETTYGVLGHSPGGWLTKAQWGKIRNTSAVSGQFLPVTLEQIARLTGGVSVAA